MNAIKRFCCCAGEDDDAIPYAPFHNEGEVNHVRPSYNPRRSVVNSSYDEPDNRQPVVDHGPPKTARELEQEKLNQIVQDTQENIIDVAHLSAAVLGTSDYIERAREYESQLQLHDARPPSVKPKSSSSKKEPRRLLDDCGNKAADWLGRHTVTTQQFQQAMETAKKMSTAMDQVQIEHKTDLIVHMEF